jgi:hypothetical protein
LSATKHTAICRKSNKKDVISGTKLVVYLLSQISWLFAVEKHSNRTRTKFNAKVPRQARLTETLDKQSPQMGAINLPSALCKNSDAIIPTPSSDALQ